MRTGRRWTKPVAQFGEKVWFRKFGEDGVSSSASRMIEGIFVGHRDRYWLHEHPGGHASCREPTMRTFTKESTTYLVKGPVCRWNVHKMPSESSEYVRKTTDICANSWRIKTALESFFEDHAQEVWERNWMNPEMQTTLLNTYPQKLIARILKALRE